MRIYEIFFYIYTKNKRYMRLLRLAFHFMAKPGGPAIPQGDIYQSMAGGDTSTSRGTGCAT